MSSVALARSLNASLQDIKIASTQSLGRLEMIMCLTYRLIFSTRLKSEVLRAAITLEVKNYEIFFDSLLGSNSSDLVLVSLVVLFFSSISHASARCLILSLKLRFCCLIESICIWRVWLVSL